jgi:integrase
MKKHFAQGALKPLSPRTASTYQKLLLRAFGTAEPAQFGAFASDPNQWAETTKRLLIFAVARTCHDHGYDPESTLSRIQRRWRQAPELHIPTEAEAVAYEKVCAAIQHRGRRAMALLPLVIGLRAEELLMLKREQCVTAARKGKLTFIRKGGKEQTALLQDGTRSLFSDLLATKSAPGKRLSAGQPQPWMEVRQILSPTTFRTAYELYRLMVHQLGEQAGIEGLRPHLLRHMFATRMSRDGADIRLIQKALGHSSMHMSARYVHPEDDVVWKNTRDWQPK